MGGNGVIEMVVEFVNFLFRVRDSCLNGLCGLIIVEIEVIFKYIQDVWYERVKYIVKFSYDI